MCMYSPDGKESCRLLHCYIYRLIIFVVISTSILYQITSTCKMQSNLTNVSIVICLPNLSGCSDHVGGK